ncbi:MAG: reverse transcriptase domain-containing protein [Alphaproteobacteria bacterium]
MKTYKNLWDEFISLENFNLAVKKAVKSKKNKKQTKFFLEHKDELLEKLRDDLQNNKYKNSRYRIFYVFEPKKREIYELPLYPDHIVHHALINVLGPIWQKRFIKDSYACIPGRGIHSAAQRAMLFVRKNKYVLQCDVRKFYPSIDHNIMMDIVARKIHDRKILWLLQKIVFSLPGGKNLPIGNLTSQWMGNLYLTELDLFVKHKLKCANYLRYSDDFCIFHNDKKFLNAIKADVKYFIEQKLNLKLSKAIVKQADGMTFVGFRLFKKFILLRQSTVKKIKKRICAFVAGNVWSDSVRSSMASMMGLMRWAKTFNLRKKTKMTVDGNFV